MGRFLGHDRVIVRFVSLYFIGLALFFTNWTIAYLLLPEGILRGVGFLPSLAGDTAAGSMVGEFIQIFVLNLVGFCVIVICNYIMRVKFFSYGCLLPLAWMIMYGITLGTNSFMIPMEETMAPSLTVFNRSGLYEMMAFILLATATNSISINESENFFSKSKPVSKDKRVPMKKEQWISVGIATLILAGAALREAYMIVNL